LFNFLKSKVNFISDNPPIKKIKPLLIETETWLNSLIKNNDFNIIDSFRNGSTKFTHFDNNHKSIYDCYIENKNKISGLLRFDYIIRLGVSWSSEYSYSNSYKVWGDDGLYDFFPIKDEHYILNQSEVPLPMFSFHFSFFECSLLDHNKNRQKKNHIQKEIFPYADLSFQNSIHYEDWDNKNLENPIRSLDIIKKKYFNFINDVNNHLYEHKININQIRDVSHPVNIDFKKINLFR